MATAKVTLVIDSADAGGTLFTRGSVRIYPSQRVADAADGILMEIAPVSARFTECGTPPPVSLFPSDLIGPQANGAPDWSYTIYYNNCPGSPQPWSFQLLSTDGATQRLSSLTPLGS